MALRFASLNMEGDRHLARVSKIFAAGYDVVYLQEAFRVNVQEFAQKYGYHYSYSTLAILTDKEGKYSPLGDWGIAILTKEEQRNTQEHFYRLPTLSKYVKNPGDPHPLSLLTTEIKVSGKTYVLGTTHFTWAMPEMADKVQKADLDNLLSILKDYPRLILAGDFNAPRGGLVQQALAQQYAYHIPLATTSTLDKDLFRIKGLELVIDHLFASDDYDVKDVQVAHGYSDHCALFATIS